MPWGKHKGTSLTDLPDGYLGWLLSKCEGLDPVLKARLEAEVRRRTFTPEPASAAVAIGDLAGQWYRQLAREFHPDLGGSHEAMKAVNRGRELLLSLAGEARA
jgi:hypothetical protein